MRPKSGWSYLTGATLLLAAGTLSGQERLAVTSAPAPTPTFSFGMIGLGMASTARLNVVNLVRTPPPIAIAQLLCKVELDLFDGQGKLIKQKTIANLGYGQADFLDLGRSELAATDTHVDISAVVKVGSNQSFFCTVSATLEVFDNVSGNTTVILANPSPTSFWPPVLSAAAGQP